MFAYRFLRSLLWRKNKKKGIYKERNLWYNKCVAFIFYALADPCRLLSASAYRASILTDGGNKVARS